ncbi:MAG: amidohydrolase family protein [Candidatus Bathyarchaeia archaeon]
MTRICDAHVHLGESGPWQPYMNPTIRVADLVRLFDRYNVERAIVFPNPNVGDEYPEMNDYIAKSVRKYPKRLVGFGRADPRRKDAVKELTRMKASLGMAGLKLHPMVECFRPDHPFFDSFFKKVNELGLPVLFHTGDGFSSPGLISKIATKYPKLLIILGHLREGALSMLERFENVYVETSGTVPDLIELAVDIGEDRVLFGSDVPYYRYPTQIAIVEASNITRKVKKKVFHDNFRKLFPEST